MSAQSRPGNKTGYLPTLDGWRCIAIVSVILYHYKGRLGPIGTLLPDQLGALGVALFFGISGLLITSRLIEEERAAGSISLRGFYTRRALRILPPLLVFLAALVVLHVAFDLPLAYRGIAATLVFVRNFAWNVGPPLEAWFTAHCWSLSIEEQFYFALPLALLLCKSWERRTFTLGLAGIVFLYGLRFSPGVSAAR